MVYVDPSQSHAQLVAPDEWCRNQPLESYCSKKAQFPQPPSVVTVTLNPLYFATMTTVAQGIDYLRERGVIPPNSSHTRAIECLADVWRVIGGGLRTDLLNQTLPEALGSFIVSVRAFEITVVPVARELTSDPDYGRYLDVSLSRRASRTVVAPDLAEVAAFRAHRVPLLLSDGIPAVIQSPSDPTLLRQRLCILPIFEADVLPPMMSLDTNLLSHKPLSQFEQEALYVANVVMKWRVAPEEQFPAQRTVFISREAAPALIYFLHHPDIRYPDTELVMEDARSLNEFTPQPLGLSKAPLEGTVSSGHSGWGGVITELRKFGRTAVAAATSAGKRVFESIARNKD